MAFMEGQQVRKKGTEAVGEIVQKLTSLDDVYVVRFGEVAKPMEKLVCGMDLEICGARENQRSA